jgi:hypothetical protein
VENSVTPHHLLARQLTLAGLKAFMQDDRLLLVIDKAHRVLLCMRISAKVTSS